MLCISCENYVLRACVCALGLTLPPTIFLLTSLQHLDVGGSSVHMVTIAVQ